MCDARAKGTNVVLIEPEVADAFPTEKAVNEALKGVLSTARAVRSTGLPNKGAAAGEPREAETRSKEIVSRDLQLSANARPALEGEMECAC
jgi:hypothetical protein